MADQSGKNEEGEVPKIILTPQRSNESQEELKSKKDFNPKNPFNGDDNSGMLI